MIEAIEASKSVSLKAVKSKGDKVAPLNLTSNKVEEVQMPSLVQAVEQNAESAQEQREQVQQATAELNKQMNILNTNIAFALSDETERMYIQVLAKDTGELIREFPIEQVRALTGYLKNAVGLLFDKES